MLVKRLGTALPFASLLAVLTPEVAHAYLDPASGSIILQVVLGGIAGIGLLIRLYWHKLLSLLGLGKARDESSEA